MIAAIADARCVIAGALSSCRTALQVAAADLPKLTGSILEWLGTGAIQMNSPNGAVQFMSADRVKQIRFDITPETSHGLKPHINVEPGGRHIWVKRHV